MKSFLVCLFTFAGMTAFAYDCEVDSIYYNLNAADNTASVTWGDNKYSGVVNIPAEMEFDGVTYAVTNIGASAFNGCWELTEVTIPNSVTSIALTEWAFDECRNLEKIVVEEGNPIYDSREDCNAIISTNENVLVVGCKNTHIPEDVTSIGYAAFSGRDGMTGFVIPINVTSIGDWAFHNCYDITEFTIPNSITYIGTGAFRYCSRLMELIIPNSVTYIGTEAFGACTGLIELFIPASLTSISSTAFFSCSGLEKIVVEEGNPIYDSRENCNALITTYNDELTIGCKNTVIPGTVTSIGGYAFGECHGLTELTIHNNVTSIGRYAFSGCRNMTDLTIGSSVTSIGECAFQWCSALTSVTSLNPVPPVIADYYEEAFESTTYQNATLHVPADCKSAYEDAEHWKNFLNIEADMPTAIGSVATGLAKNNAAIYTLDGVKLNTTNPSALPSGIYVVNGKKVIVK